MADELIVGATSSTYVPVDPDDVGRELYCKVTATNAYGSATADSNIVGPIEEGSSAPSEPALTNLYFWLKADAGTLQASGGAAAAADGDPIGEWQDQSGNGNHFIQGTADNKPTLQLAELNSLPIVRLDSTSFTQSMVGPDMTALTAGEIFIVCKNTTSGDQNAWLFGSDLQSVYYPYSGDNGIYDQFGTTTRHNTGVPAVSLMAWRLYNALSVSGEWSNFIDGTLQYTTATNSVGFFTTPRFGRSLGGSWNADVAEIIMYSAKCSAPDKTQTKAYLAGKYNLTIA